MTTTLSNLMAELSPVQRREVRARARQLIREVESAQRLDQVRKAMHKTQSEIAASLGVGQNAVSQLESRSDIQLSTLDRYVRSLGFELELALVGVGGERAVLRNFRPWRVMDEPVSLYEEASKRGRPVLKSAPAKTVRTAATGRRVHPSGRQ